jgi:hypothetical protein
MTMVRFAATLALLITAVTAQNADYGVDCSFPIHSKEFKCGNLLGDRKKFYEDFMEGCRKYYGRKADRCDTTEDDRIEMSLRQPQSMVNYTSTGFKKIKAPKKTMDLLLDHWNKNHMNEKEEIWTGKSLERHCETVGLYSLLIGILPNWVSAGNVYVNHWEAKTYMTSVEDTSLRGGGYKLKNEIWDSVKEIIEQWTGMEQRPISMYGIRSYKRGAVLSPHVDRLPLVSSCIINVAQDVDEEWPLEVYDRHDRAVNVTMIPGDMVLYESGSLMHGASSFHF